MNILRKLLFYIFLIAYLISCPLIILQTMGIVFKMDSRFIEKTGLIYLSTIPSGATVYINNKKFPDRTPAIIRNLYPGKYHIKIYLDRYETWDKLLPVREEKATAAEYILLIPDNWKTEKLTDDPFEDIVTVDNQPFMLLSKGPLLKDQLIYRQKEDSYAILPDGPEGEVLRIRKIYSVPGSPFLLFEGTDRGKESFIWANLRTDPVYLQDVTELFPASPQDVLWSAGDGKILYAAIDGILHILDLDAKTASSVPDEKIESFAFANNRLYILTENNLLKRYDAKGEKAETLLDVPGIRRPFPWTRQHFKIAVPDDKLILLISREGALLYNQLQYISINKSIKGYSYNKNIEKLLLWTNNDIGFVDFIENDETGLFKLEPRLTWLGVKTRNIKKAFWVNNGNQVLFHTGNKVFLTETKTFNQTRVTGVVSIKNGTSVGYSQRTGLLYYLDHKSRRLFSASIVPQMEIFPRANPEEAGQDMDRTEAVNAI